MKIHILYLLAVGLWWFLLPALLAHTSMQAKFAVLGRGWETTSLPLFLSPTWGQQWLPCRAETTIPTFQMGKAVRCPGKALLGSHLLLTFTLPQNPPFPRSSTEETGKTQIGFYFLNKCFRINTRRGNDFSTNSDQHLLQGTEKVMYGNFIYLGGEKGFLYLLLDWHNSKNKQGNSAVKLVPWETETRQGWRTEILFIKNILKGYL